MNKQAYSGNLLGIVLCGGESKRMGSDKGLLMINNIPWAAYIAQMLKNNSIPVVVSINQSQYKTYKEIFPDTPLILDKAQIRGPLNGLLSIHDTYPQKDLLLMACDLIDMQSETLKNLIRIYESKPGREFYVYQHEGFSQPFCAIYTAKGMAKVYRKFKSGEIRKFSLHDRFEDADTLYIPVENEKSFNNYNSM